MPRLPRPEIAAMHSTAPIAGRWHLSRRRCFASAAGPAARRLTEDLAARQLMRRAVRASAHAR